MSRSLTITNAGVYKLQEHNTAHEMTPGICRDCALEEIRCLESQLAQAREEIDRIRGRKGPSLCCRIYAMPLEAKLSKLERVRELAERVIDGRHGTLVDEIRKDLAALRETEGK
jgi:hypothetical protein